MTKLTMVLKKLVCGCMVLVGAGQAYLIGQDEACRLGERRCEVQGLPPENPHGPENDHRPSNTIMRKIAVVTSSTSATGLSASSLDLKNFPMVRDT
jgi:hypothetical protein